MPGIKVKIICLYDTNQEMDLTSGKIYDATLWKKSVTGAMTDYYNFISDIGNDYCSAYVAGLDRFQVLSEYRDERINEILNE